MKSYKSRMHIAFTVYVSVCNSFEKTPKSEDSAVIIAGRLLQFSYSCEYDTKCLIKLRI